MIQRSEDGRQRVLSLSYGKDSMACLGAIEELGWTLDRIITADVWATETIPAELPPMVEFKGYADRTIKERWGVEVEHFRPSRTYEQRFYCVRTDRSTHNAGMIYGWPFTLAGAWCNSDIKMDALRKAIRSCMGCVQYIGIAADEPNRFHSITCTKISPLVELGWTEADCRRWCEENGLLSPIYQTSARGGCWFCHNQSVGQLRHLRREYPDLWTLMLKWDSDSPTTFKTDGRTVHDYDKRFQLEDEGFLSAGDKGFRWSMLEEELNYRLF